WPAPEPSLTLRLSDWIAASAYGVVRLDYFDDSTQSFDLRANDALVQRQGTIRGDRGQNQVRSGNSRLGLKIGSASAGRFGWLILAEGVPHPLDFAWSSRFLFAA